MTPLKIFVEIVWRGKNRQKIRETIDFSEAAHALLMKMQQRFVERKVSEMT